MNGKLVIISAPSGAGKTTIVKYLLENGLDLEFSVSATTRVKRENETDGKDYYFITPQEFRSRIEKDNFVEWEEVYTNHYYGTLKSELDRIWSMKRHVLFDVDVRGGVKLKRIFGTKALSIFIMPPSVEELEKRLIYRGTDTPEKIKMRVSKAAEEMTLSGKFDHVVINDDLQRAQKEAFTLVSLFLKS